VADYTCIWTAEGWLYAAAVQSSEDFNDRTTRTRPRRDDRQWLLRSARKRARNRRGRRPSQRGMVGSHATWALFTPL